MEDNQGFAAVAAALTPSEGWLIHQHVGYDGLLTIVATDDPNRLILAFSDLSEGTKVMTIKDETVMPLGVFENIGAALDAVTRSSLVAEPA